MKRETDMRVWVGTMLSAFVVSAVLVGTGVSAEQARPESANTRSEGTERACLDVAEMNEQDRNAMREFMRSDRAPEMMGRMMQMARGMGSGDVMAGMTRMMDMMGSSGSSGMGGSGGMMRGQGGMMRPAPSSK
jgi:hypothetical protein